MEVRNKATSIDLFTVKTPQMRAFHMSWFAFFLCFFAWFGIAPLLGVVGQELGLSKDQLYNSLIASVTITIFARLFIGWLCDRIGPRLSYTMLLVFGSIPVMGIGLAETYEAFLLFRLGIGVIGASFVITQYHTSVMFAPNCVGTANATSAGWGNLGGGVTQMIMPLVFAGFVGIGFLDESAWRLSMVAAGGVCLVTGFAYFFLTTDLPDGNFKELRASGELVQGEKQKGGFWLACKDYRVWALFFIYAACFGIELTINGMAAMYFREHFELGLKTAGLVAGLFGLMNIFARTLGGFISDRFVRKGGLRGRVLWLFIALLAEGIALVCFSQIYVLAFAIPMLIVFSLFVQMSEGATFSIVPFINKKALGPVAGIVGAGGNAGAVGAGMMFRFGGLGEHTTLLVLGFIVTGIAFLSFLVRFSTADEKAAAEEFDRAMARRREEQKDRVPLRELIPGIRHLRPMDALRIYLGIALVIKGIFFITNMADLEAKVNITNIVGVESAVDSGDTRDDPPDPTNQDGDSPRPNTDTENTSEETSNAIGLGQQMIAWSVVFAHVIGGACLLLGFVTRLSAAANAVILFGAVIAALTGAAGEGSLLGTNVDFQFASFVFFSLVLFVWRGSGPLSLDHLIRLDAEKEPEIL